MFAVSLVGRPPLCLQGHGRGQALKKPGNHSARFGIQAGARGRLCGRGDVPGRPTSLGYRGDSSLVPTSLTPASSSPALQQTTASVHGSAELPAKYPGSNLTARILHFLVVPPALYQSHLCPRHRRRRPARLDILTTFSRCFPLARSSGFPFGLFCDCERGVRCPVDDELTCLMPCMACSSRSILCIGFGFIVTKADIFPSVAARACGQILLVRHVFAVPGRRPENFADHRAAMPDVLEDRPVVFARQHKYTR